MSKTYLVTGGAGFIGHHLVRKLIESGHKVKIIDNFSTGVRNRIHPQAELLEADISRLDKIKDFFQGVDGVFHVAALPRVQFSIEEPVVTHQTNINGTLNVLLAAKEAGVKRLVYSASSSAYGGGEEMPQHELLKPNPISPYALQKYVGEEYAKLAAMFWNLETVSLRYFNVFGPEMADEGAYKTVISVFCEQFFTGQPLTVTGDGLQTRDFTFVDDVVRANIMAMESDKVGQGEVMNIGGSDNRSVQSIAEVFGGQIEHIAPRVEPHDSLADTTKAKELLGWQPLTGFDEGLKITIEYYKGLYNKK